MNLVLDKKPKEQLDALIVDPTASFVGQEVHELGFKQDTQGSAG